MDKQPHSKDEYSSQAGQQEEKESSGVSMTVVRDTIYIFVFTIVGGLLNSFAIDHLFGDGFLRTIILFCCIMAMLTLGFTVSACLVRGNRWFHLFQVALGIWLIGEVLSFVHSYNHYARPQRLIDLILWIVMVAFGMLVGGTLSYLFKRGGPKTSAS